MSELPHISRTVSFSKIIVSIVLLISLVAVSGCVGGGGDSENGATITIITRHDTSIQELFEEAFLDSAYAQDANITKVRFMQPVSGLWPTAIENGGIDVAWGGGPTLFDQMVDLGYLYPMSPATMGDTLDSIPDTISGAPMKRYGADTTTPLWIAAAISSFGYTVNLDILERYDLEKPLTWDDLANSEYYRDPPVVGIGNAPDTTSNTRIYEIILQNYGWDDGWIKLTEIAANSGIYYGSVDVLNAVETGEIGIGTTIDFYGYSAMLDYPSTEYIIPTGQSLINADPIAIVYNTEQPDVAEAFVEFVLSAEGQAIWLDETINRMPVLSEAFDTEFGLTRPDLKALFEETISNQGIEFSDELVNSYESTVVTYWEAVLDKPHEELRLAWHALIEAMDDGKLTSAQWDEYVGRLGEPLITLEGAQAINEQILMDSSVANQKSVEWAQMKKDAYQDILDEIENL